jgi:phosphonate transport system substrate-binding protein
MLNAHPILKPLPARSIALILLAFLLFFLVPAQARSKPLVFGVHPYLHPSVLIERFEPLIKYLQNGLGQPIRIRVGTSYEDHIQAFSRGEIDFGFFGPAAFIKLTYLDMPYRPLGRLSFSGKDTFQGAIVVRQDSPLQSLHELAGKNFAFGDPNSTLSSLVPRRMLQDAGVDLRNLAGFSNLTNHHNVALAVLLGKYDAGSVKSEVLREYQPRGLRVLQWTPEIPTHLFVAGPGLSPQKTERLMQLLQSLHNTDQARTLLSRIKQGTTQIIPAHTSEYLPLRRFIFPGGG